MNIQFIYQEKTIDNQKVKSFTGIPNRGDCGLFQQLVFIAFSSTHPQNICGYHSIGS